MNKAMVYIRFVSHVIVMLLFIAFVGFIGVLAYQEGYTNGENNGSIFTARYVAQQCHAGGNLELFGVTYHCGRVRPL